MTASRRDTSRPGEIIRSYSDNQGKTRTVPAATIAALTDALGPMPDVAPTDHASKAWLPEWARSNRRAFGLAVQLYAVRSQRNWGIGDFTDLARIVAWAERHGAAYVGLNPLHALFLADPSRRSPYYPSSRLFLNPLYIDPVALADDLGVESDLSEEDRERIEHARGGDIVDYAAVSAAKLPVLRRLFEIHEAAANAAMGQDRGTFSSARGTALRRHATFDALSSAMAESDGAGFSGWPEEFRDPASPAVADFVRQNPREIAFFTFLQWAADRQLRAAVEGRQCRLYLDIAVGAAPDGAEVWGGQEVFVPGARLGAPPDLMASGGQDWGLAPFNPRRLMDTEFSALKAMLAASMGYAGAVRIDHILGFDRQYVIPDGVTAAEGGYIKFPRAVMIDAAARQSENENCLVIGEALGTVPEGLIDDLHKADIFSYEVTRWARDKTGAFLDAGEYPEKCLAVVGTHDIPTTPAYVAGEDIQLRRRLGHIDEQAVQRETRERKSEVRALGKLWGIDPAVPDDQIVLAAHRFLGRSSARLVMGTLEDLLLQREQVNVPGTTDEHPNWSIRVPRNLEEWAADDRVSVRFAALERT